MYGLRSGHWHWLALAGTDAGYQTPDTQVYEAACNTRLLNYHYYYYYYQYYYYYYILRHTALKMSLTHATFQPWPMAKCTQTIQCTVQHVHLHSSPANFPDSSEWGLCRAVETCVRRECVSVFPLWLRHLSSTEQVGQNDVNCLGRTLFKKDLPPPPKKIR